MESCFLEMFERDNKLYDRQNILSLCFCFIDYSDEIFTSADAAYVLAYSIIMLTTDLHSSQVLY